MRFISLSFLLLIVSSAISASTATERLEVIETEISNINQRIKEGMDKSLFKATLDKFEKEKAALKKQIALEANKAPKISPPKPKAKPVVNKKIRVLPNITLESTSVEGLMAEIDKKIETEKKEYLSMASRGIAGKRLEQKKINITALELEKSKLEKISKNKSYVNKSMFKYKGHFQLRTESSKYRRGATAVERQSEQTFSRLRTYFTFSPNDKLDFNITPQATKGFGQDISSGTVSSGGVNHTEVLFFESNINYKVFNDLSIKLGRQEVSFGDHLFIGALPWDNRGRSFDALRADYKYGFGKSTFLYSKISDNSTEYVSTDDKDLFVLYNTYNYMSILNPLDIYIVNQTTDASDLETNMFGFRVKGSYGMFFYRTENAIQSGRNMPDDAYQINLEGGAKFMKSSLSLEYSVAGSGYVQFYPTAHKFFGFADVLGRRNIKHFALHAKTNILPWLMVRADYHNFKREDTTKSAYKLNGSSTWGTTGSSDDIGDEIDVVFVFKTKDSLKFQLGGAWFNPGTYMKENSGTAGETTRFIYGQVNASF